MGLNIFFCKPNFQLKYEFRVQCIFLKRNFFALKLLSARDCHSWKLESPPLHLIYPQLQSLQLLYQSFIYPIPLHLASQQNFIIQMLSATRSLSPSDLEFLPLCSCTRSKAVFYCHQPTCLSSHQLLYCEYCSDEERHDHGVRKIGNVVAQESEAIVGAISMIGEQHGRVHEQVDGFMSLIEYLSGGEGVRISRKREIYEDIKRCDRVYEEARGIQRRLNELVVRFRVIELIEMRKSVQQLEAEIQSTEYLMQLNEETIYENFKEVIKETKSSKWMEKLDPNMKEYYIQFKLRVQDEQIQQQREVFEAQLEQQRIHKISESREFSELTNRIRELTEILSKLAPQVQPQTITNDEEDAKCLDLLERTFNASTNHSLKEAE